MTITVGILVRPSIRIDNATTSELNGLAANGVVVTNTAFSNVIGDTQGEGAPSCEASLNLGAPAAAFGVNAALYVWLLESGETATLTTGTTTTGPITSRPPDLVIGVEQIATAQSNKPAFGRLPLSASNTALIWNVTGQALAASGNSLYVKPQTQQGN